MFDFSFFFNNRFDHTLQPLINRHWISPSLDWFMASITSFAVWFPLLLILSFFLFWLGGNRMRLMLITLLITLAFVDGVMIHGIKRLVGRPRPLQVEPGVRRVDLKYHHTFPILGLFKAPSITYPVSTAPTQPVQGGSFPSAHTANNMAAAVVLARFYRRFGFFAILMAMIISYSRLYVGAHWPIDVLTGAFLGVLGAWWMTKWLNTAWQVYAPRFSPKLSREVSTLF